MCYTRVMRSLLVGPNHRVPLRGECLDTDTPIYRVHSLPASTRRHTHYRHSTPAYQGSSIIEAARIAEQLAGVPLPNTTALNRALYRVQLRRRSPAVRHG